MITAPPPPFYCSEADHFKGRCPVGVASNSTKSLITQKSVEKLDSYIHFCFLC